MQFLTEFSFLCPLFKLIPALLDFLSESSGGGFLIPDTWLAKKLIKTHAHHNSL